MTPELTKAAQQALEALEAVMHHVRREAPHLTGKLWGFADSSADALRRALTQRPAALQPGASNEATTQAQGDSSGDVQVDQGRVRDADSRVGSTVPELTQRPAAQTEREAFEAWARPNGYDLRRNDVLGHYSSIDTSRAWSGFRAGCASLPAPQQATPEHDMAAMLERGAKAWAGVDPQDLRAGATPEPVGGAALERYKRLGIGDEESPIERLRGFLSIALSDQDWLDVEPFLDALTRPAPVETEPVGEVVAWWHVNRLGGIQAFTSEPPPSLKAECRPLVFGDTRHAPGVPEGWREVIEKMVKGIDHLAELARQWEPDHSSGADRKGWVLAKNARDEAVDMLAAAQVKGGEHG